MFGPVFHRRRRLHAISCGANVGVNTVNKNYESLQRVLDRAFVQASEGKGAERHAQDLPFEEQPMQKLCAMYGVGFALGQAAKKAQESQRMPVGRAVAELLGAINYLAGAVVFLEGSKALGPPAIEASAKRHVWVPWVGRDVRGEFIPSGMLSGTRVCLMFRDGKIVRGCEAGDYSWKTTDDDDDIIAYYKIALGADQ